MPSFFGHKKLMSNLLTDASRFNDFMTICIIMAFSEGYADEL